MQYLVKIWVPGFRDSFDHPFTTYAKATAFYEAQVDEYRDAHAVKLYACKELAYSPMYIEED